MQDTFIACVDGLKGFPEATETIYPKTAVQLCRTYGAIQLELGELATAHGECG